MTDLKGMAKTKDNSTIKALGRRKTATARVRLSVGKGMIMVNGKDLKEYFNLTLWQQKILSPLAAVGKEHCLPQIVSCGLPVDEHALGVVELVDLVA